MLEASKQQTGFKDKPSENQEETSARKEGREAKGRKERKSVNEWPPPRDPLQRQVSVLVLALGENLESLPSTHQQVNTCFRTAFNFYDFQQTGFYTFSIQFVHLVSLCTPAAMKAPRLLFISLALRPLLFYFRSPCFSLVLSFSFFLHFARPLSSLETIPFESRCVTCFLQEIR